VASSLRRAETLPGEPHAENLLNDCYRSLTVLINSVDLLPPFLSLTFVPRRNSAEDIEGHQCLFEEKEQSCNAPLLNGLYAAERGSRPLSGVA
jgi:hypothetical protein